MNRKRIITFAVVTIIAVIVTASIYEAFDVHDTKPFPIDPEFLFMMLSSLFAMCLGVLLTLPLSRLILSIVDFLHQPWKSSSFSSPNALHDARLLFSLPLNSISLRI
jgi:hypothetical protein